MKKRQGQLCRVTVHDHGLPRVSFCSSGMVLKPKWVVRPELEACGDEASGVGVDDGPVDVDTLRAMVRARTADRAAAGISRRDDFILYRMDDMCDSRSKRLWDRVEIVRLLVKPEISRRYGGATTMGYTEVQKCRSAEVQINDRKDWNVVDLRCRGGEGCI